MIDLNESFSLGATLEALRYVQENIRFFCRFFPEAADTDINAGIHDIARANRRIFETYLRGQQNFQERAVRGTADRAAA